MNKRSIALCLCLVPAVVFLSCARGGEQEPAQQSGMDTGYPTSQATYTPEDTAQPVATANPLQQVALPCQADVTCGLHRCNLAAGRCTFPCQTHADCQAGSQCFAPVCVLAGVLPQ